jgi:hypothetical protein
MAQIPPKLQHSRVNYPTNVKAHKKGTQPRIARNQPLRVTQPLDSVITPQPNTESTQSHRPRKPTIQMELLGV